MLEDDFLKQNNIEIIKVNDEIIENENKKEILKLSNDSKILKETMEDINNLLSDSGIIVNNIDEKISKSNKDIEITTQEIEKSHNYFFKSNILKATAISALVGLCVGGPIGGVLGYTIGTIGVGIISGSVIGSVGCGGITHAIVKKKVTNI